MVSLSRAYSMVCIAFLGRERTGEGGHNYGHLFPSQTTRNTTYSTHDSETHMHDMRYLVPRMLLLSLRRQTCGGQRETG